jgi:hypothetical protein
VARAGQERGRCRPQVRREVLGHADVEVWVLDPPDQAEGKFELLELSQVPVVAGYFGQQHRCHLAEGRSGPGLPAEVLVDERAEELVVTGSLVVGESSTELAALELQQLGEKRSVAQPGFRS